MIATKERLCSICRLPGHRKQTCTQGAATYLPGTGSAGGVTHPPPSAAALPLSYAARSGKRAPDSAAVGFEPTTDPSVLLRLVAELRAGLVALEAVATEGLPLLHVRQSVALLGFVERTLKEVRRE